MSRFDRIVIRREINFSGFNPADLFEQADQI